MERDQSLPKHRDRLLEKALQDLTADPDVLAIYLAGSLARGNADVYSDIDLHTVVNPEKIEGFI
ncbi:nucleotidyltransferase domain-containing protein [Mesobacillus foraminis]|uniref:nucleotidyltransferase domain-containing protein n=1 Tax=Mesobacillus foraminis TaxID=279826 RepID=UPI001F5430CB|nr:nucleotidyltransferase domain-containing protein [Mesobacillus foraminis]